MYLKQRKLFAIRKFEFKETGLFIKEKNLTSSHETVIAYEDIALENLSRRQKTDNIIIAVTAVFGLMFVMFFTTKIFGGEADWSVIIGMFFFTLLGGLLTYVSWKTEVIIPLYSAGALVLFERIPNKDEVDQFLVDLSRKINIYLREKYAKIDHDLPSEGQLNNFIYLRERKAIDQDEFNALKESLLKGKNQSEIGFKK